MRLRALRDSPDAFGSTFEKTSLVTDKEWELRLQRVSLDFDLPAVALIEATYAGMAWGRIERPEDEFAHLFQMWVAPEFRGKGIARKLLDTVLSWAVERGRKALALSVTCGDTPARRLYESTGFVAIGQPESLRPGSDLMVQPMRLQLRTSGT